MIIVAPDQPRSGLSVAGRIAGIAALILCAIISVRFFAAAPDADAAEADPDTPKLALERLRRMEGFVTNLTGWYAQIRKLPQGTLIKLMNMGTRIARFVGSPG